MMTTTGKVLCYDLPEPTWILPPWWSEVVAKMPETRPGFVSVRITFADRKYYDTAIVHDRLVILPDPYNTRDIAEIRRLVTT